jgi:microcystin-dependent protein
MPSTAAPYSLPYPAASDSPTGNTQLQALAEAVAAQPAVATPPGNIAATARATAPSGWLICDGAAVSRTTYAGLYSAIGTAYGVGNGSTTFNLPDYRGRVIVGTDATGAHSSGITANAQTGGEQNHTLTPAETALRYHAHDMQSLTAGGTPPATQALSGQQFIPGSAAIGSGGTDYTYATTTTGSFRIVFGVGGITGGEVNGSPHTNMQPWQSARIIIKT